MNSRLCFLAMMILLGVAASTVACGCGDDDDDDDSGDDTSDDDDGGDDDSGDDDAADDDSGDDDCGAEALLPGSWTSEMIAIDIAEDLTYHAVGATDTGYDVTGTIEVTGCVASFTDLAGENPCPSDQVGQYDFVVTETTLTTSLVEDACAGRAVGLDGTVFTREP